MRCGNQHDATSPHACAALGAAWHTDSGRRNSCNVSLCRLCALPVSSCLSVSLSLCLSVSLSISVLVCLSVSLSLLSYVGLLCLENFSYGARRSLAWLRILSRFLSVFQQDTGVDLFCSAHIRRRAQQSAQHALVFGRADVGRHDLLPRVSLCECVCERGRKQLPTRQRTGERPRLK